MNFRALTAHLDLIKCSQRRLSARNFPIPVLYAENSALKTLTRIEMKKKKREREERRKATPSSHEFYKIPRGMGARPAYFVKTAVRGENSLHSL